MKKLLAILCLVSLLAIPCTPGFASAPELIAGEDGLTVNYDNPNAKGKYTYVLLDAMGRVSLVEIDVGDTWKPDWKQDGLYKVQVYYKDKNGVTHSEESEYQELRFPVKYDPISYDDLLDDNNDPLPSSFSRPVEYNEPTPKPAQAPIYQPSAPNGALLYTLAPTQPLFASTPAPYYAPTVAPTAVPTVSYPGTRPCFEHLNLRIRISDNDGHIATVGRSAPGKDMPQVATLNVGEVYEVLDCRIVEQGNVHWFMIKKNNVICWVASGRCERY